MIVKIKGESMSSVSKDLGKKTLTAVLTLLMVILGQISFAQSSEDAFRSEKFKVTDRVSLEVRTSGGSISVYGSENEQVVVEMFVRKNGELIEAGSVELENYSIEIFQDGNTVKAIANRKNKNWNWKNDYSVSFVVYAPRDTRSRLKTSGGSLSVENLTGSQELKTSGGSINAEGIRGEMSLDTSGGHIRVKDAQGDLVARTSGGTIEVEALVGDLDAKTSGGSLQLSGIEGNVDAKTSGGSIRAEVLSPADHIELKTSGGSISISVPEGNGYDIDLDGNSVNAKLANFTGEAEKDEVRGTLNGGGTKIKAKTSGGSVSLNYL